jgi:flagellum-specific peptidoglycan hydrolase FlgJ
MALKSQQDPRYTTDPDFARKIDRVLAVTDPEYVEAHLS